MSNKTSGGDFLAGFLVGALVGAAAAFLFAPQSGEETRALIRDKGIELQERAGEISEEARKKAESLQAQAKGKADNLSTKTREQADKLQAKVKQAVEEGKSAATETKEALLSRLEERGHADEGVLEI